MSRFWARTDVPGVRNDCALGDQADVTRMFNFARN
jgi:hypothetical protein